jgi:hypothetical protein
MSIMRLVIGIIAILATLATTSCTSDKATTVEVDVRLNVCTSSGACNALRVPNAEVVLNTQGGQQVATTKTEDDGIARLTLDEKLAGQHTVVVKTPLWKDKEKSYTLLVVAGSHHQLTLTGNLGETCCAP